MLAEPPECGPFHQRLRRLCYLHRRSDCYRLERPVAGRELHPLKTCALSRQAGRSRVGVGLLAAVFSAPAAAGALVPIEIVDLLVSIVLYWVLLAWLFSLEARDLFVSVVILFLVRLVGGVVTATILVGLLT